jgi:phenylacetate-CoA ligase
MAADDHYDLDAVNEQLERCLDLEFYDGRVAPVDSWEAFRELPLLTQEEVFDSVAEDPPFGSLYREDVTLTTLTPAGQDSLLVEYATEADLAAVGEEIGAVLRAAGIGERDVVVSCFGYTPFAGGYLFHEGLRNVGANVLPLGPGEADRTADIVEKYDVTVLLSPPSFAMDVAARGGTDVDTVVCSGEPFSVVPGYREQLKDAFGGATTVDYYGLSEVGPVAAEDGTEGALYVRDSFVLLEVVDPETGAVLPVGERGEAVVTHLRKEAMPLVRYRTGDLTELAVDDGRLALPRGIFGRTDDMVKVKGVKTYPGQLALVFHGTPGLTGCYRVVVSRPENTDHLRIECESDDPSSVDVDDVAATIGEKLLVRPDEVELVEEVDAEGMALEDGRF